jgi:hypothetical protein
MLALEDFTSYMCEVRVGCGMQHISPCACTRPASARRAKRCMSPDRACWCRCMGWP